VVTILLNTTISENFNNLYLEYSRLAIDTLASRDELIKAHFNKSEKKNSDVKRKLGNDIF
jgi:hypothetical protein